MNIGSSEAFDRPKHIDLKYRGSPTMVDVTTPIEYYTLCVPAYVRGLAVENKVLDPLWCEDNFVDCDAVTATVQEACIQE